MNSADWIALSASVAAFVSALATLLTVREMQRQREASYRPDLTIPKLWVTAKSEANCELKLPTLWNCRDDDHPRAWGAVRAPIVNLGRGAAKNLEIDWQLDVDVLVTEINAMAARTMPTVHFEHTNGIVVCRTQSTIHWMSLWKNQKVSHLDYVLPSNASDPLAELVLPDAYVRLASAYVYFQVRNGSAPLREVPSLRLHITFEDIGGIASQRMYAGRLELSVASAEAFDGSFELSSVS